MSKMLGSRPFIWLVRSMITINEDKARREETFIRSFVCVHYEYSLKEKKEREKKPRYINNVEC